MSVSQCLKDRKVSFPKPVSKKQFTSRLKHITSCFLSRAYADVRVGDYMDATTNPAGRRGLRLHSPETVWISYVNAVKAHFAIYGVNMSYEDFSPSGKTLRNFRDFLWNSEVSDSAKS